MFLINLLQITSAEITAWAVVIGAVLTGIATIISKRTESSGILQDLAELKEKNASLKAERQERESEHSLHVERIREECEKEKEALRILTNELATELAVLKGNLQIIKDFKLEKFNIEVLLKKKGDEDRR